MTQAQHAQQGRQGRLTHIQAPEGVAPGRGYTHVVIGTGRVVAISGQVAFDSGGAVVGVGDPAAQARQVFENLQRCLAAAGASFDDVIKLTYFVTDVAHMPAIRTVRDEFLGTSTGTGPLPASTAVQVAALVFPDLLLEIEALALID
ncbi:MAG TPA: RidA family protein [Streptosporangiaceae bacterium]|jgi:enamine deaminase RidA (YjgF/YER057c/UK114 family)